MLILSIIALLCGPLLFFIVQRRPVLFELLDGFIFVVIGGLALFHFLPEVIEQGHWPTLLFLAFGLLAPTLLERFFRQIARQTHDGTLLLSGIGLAIHAMTDGVAISANGEHGMQQLLALSIVLHRLPVGLMVWWLLRPHFGRTLASSVLLLMCSATLGGYFMGEQWLLWLDNRGMAWFQALVVGSILHVVVHRPYHEDQEPLHDEYHHGHKETSHWLDGIGSLLGLGVLLMIMVPHWLGHHAHHHLEHAVPALDDESVSIQVLHGLLAMGLRCAPYLLAAYLIGMLMHRIVHNRGNARGGRGILLGIFALSPTSRYPGFGFYSAGLAKTLMSVPTLLVTLALLGWQWTLWRALTALLVTIVLSGILSIGAGSTDQEPPLPTLSARQLIEQSAPWILVGLIVGALLLPLDVSGLPWWGQLAAVILIALPLPLQALGITPVALALAVNHVEPSVIMVLLVASPCVKLTILFHRRPLLRYGVPLLAVGLALLLSRAGPLATPRLEWLNFQPQDTGMGYWSALAVMVLIFMVMLLRRGARNFLAGLLSPEQQANISHHHH